MLNRNFFSNGVSQNRIRTRIWDWLIAPSALLKTIEEKRTARLAASFLLAIALLDTIGGMARIPRWGFISAFSGSLGFSLLTSLISYGLSRTRWYRAGIFLFSLGFGFSAHISIATQGADADFSTLLLVYVPLSLIVASSFLSSWSVLLLTVLNIAALLSLGFFGSTLLPDNIGAQSGIIFTIGIVLIILANFRKNLEQIRLAELREINLALEESRDKLEERVAERTRSAEVARAEADSARRASESQAWLTRGQAQLAEKMRGDLSIEALANNVTSHLCQYLGAQTGAFFLAAGDRLKLTGRYAYKEHVGHKDDFGFGENLIGEAVKANRIILVDNIPVDAPLVFSALGDTMPRQLLIAPIETEGQIVGAVELATLDQFSAAHEAFLSRVSESIAVAFRTTQTHAQVNELLAQSQIQAEELQVQEEELRAANEELQAQADNLKSVRGLRI